MKGSFKGHKPWNPKYFRVLSFNDTLCFIQGGSLSQLSVGMKLSPFPNMIDIHSSSTFLEVRSYLDNKQVIKS